MSDDDWIQLGGPDVTRESLQLTAEAALSDLEGDLNRRGLRLAHKPAVTWVAVGDAADRVLADLS